MKVATDCSGGMPASHRQGAHATAACPHGATSVLGVNGRSLERALLTRSEERCLGLLQLVRYALHPGAVGTLVERQHTWRFPENGWWNGCLADKGRSNRRLTLRQRASVGVANQCRVGTVFGMSDVRQRGVICHLGVRAISAVRWGGAIAIG